MKQSILAALAVILLWTVLPLLTVPSAAGTQSGIAQTEERRAEPEQTKAAGEPAQDGSGSSDPGAAGEPGPAAAQPGEAADEPFDRTFFLPVRTDEGVRSMDLETYLTGTVLAELPASFSPEAKKAQAVACRTYALRSYERRRHEDAALCTDSGCCQGWTDPARADPAAREAALVAVRETDGLVVCCGGALIEATFFSCSGGRTEAAAAVWGSDVPYLQPVESPGEEGAAHYRDEVRVSLDAFCAILEQADPAVCFPAEKGGWIGAVTATPGGGVDTIVLGGRSFRGTDVRRLFSLRSTAFTLELTDREAVFSTRGYGHRVGMSQYGAEAMARAGAGFEEILLRYYQGTEVRRMDQTAP